MQESAKTYGNALFDRLHRADDVLSSLAGAAQDMDRSVAFVLGMTRSVFLGFASVPPTGDDIRVFGAAAALPTTHETLRVESVGETEGRTRVQGIVGQNGRVWVVLTRPLPQRAGASLVGILDLEGLWGSPDELDQRVSLCVLGPQSVRLFCSSADTWTLTCRADRRPSRVPTLRPAACLSERGSSFSALDLMPTRGTLTWVRRAPSCAKA